MIITWIEYYSNSLFRYYLVFNCYQAKKQAPSGKSLDFLLIKLYIKA